MNLPVCEGTGINDTQLQHKITILENSENYNGAQDVDSLLAYFGGFEIMQMAGEMLQAK
jgi:nicotinate-nucleotide--dimethylbenzimidazole phosphoribosyltransferase